jgi:hypothetical protein
MTTGRRWCPYEWEGPSPRLIRAGESPLVVRLCLRLCCGLYTLSTSGWPVTHCTWHVARGSACASHQAQPTPCVRLCVLVQDHPRGH